MFPKDEEFSFQAAEGNVNQTTLQIEIILSDEEDSEHDEVSSVMQN